MPAARINFTSATRQLIADLAGHRCSHVGCARLTVGPGKQANSKRTIGKACHIYSAAPGGPRGQNGLTPAQLSSPENGVWMCGIHSDLVDKKTGVDYPAATLLAYKGLQEAKAMREMSGLGYPVHWLEQLTIRWNPLFVNPSVVRFGKVTVVAGPNMAGKSALCDWIAGFGDQQRLWRWLPNGKTVTELDLQLDYHQPEPVSVRMQIPASGQLGFSVNGQPGPVQPMRLNFVYLHEEWRRDGPRPADDVEIICRHLEVDALLLPNLFPLIDSDGLGYVRNLKLEEDADEDGENGQPKIRRRLQADVIGTKKGLVFGVLSHGEQQYVLIELAVALAKYTAKFAPTMLLLDYGMHRFPNDVLVPIMEALSERKILFQTVIVLPRSENTPVPTGTSWTVVRLFEDGRLTGVKQN